MQYKIVCVLTFACFALSACKNVKDDLAVKEFAAVKEQDDTLATEVSDEIHNEPYPDCYTSQANLERYFSNIEHDIWSRIRKGYALGGDSKGTQNNPRIDAELKWYSRHPEYMKRVTARGDKYLFHIVDQLEAREMPLEIALLPIVESAFDPFAYSHSRASGMWQIIPGTGKMLGLKQNWWYDGRRDVMASTDAALTYLQRLHKRFDGDWLLALAAYNSGAGNVSKAIRKNKKRNKPTDFWHLDLPRETKAYVPRLLALSKLFAEPSKYGLDLHPVSNSPYFASIHIGSQIDLAQASKLAGIDMDELYHLNPGFNRWATDPTGPHELLVPIDSALHFAGKVAEIPASERVAWDRYTIKSGDTLSTIASRYKLSVKSLKSINKLSSNRIRAGKTLMVPIAAQSGKHYSFSVDERIAKRYDSVDKKHKGQSISYTVKAGDSLWSIGRKYNVGVRKIARWNSMAPKDAIKPGQVLKIWTTTAKNKNSGVVRKLSYKVRSGDSLARIASKFGIKIKDIINWNSVERNKYLQPGQRLTLFVDVTKSP